MGANEADKGAVTGEPCQAGKLSRGVSYATTLNPPDGRGRWASSGYFCGLDGWLNSPEEGPRCAWT